jgi:transcriptional regulator with XRE-family HTH domain
MSEFGPLLKKFRESKGVSQSKLAERASLCHSYISRLESGARMPTREAVDRLAAALRLEPEERDRLHHAAGFLGTGATIDLGEFRAWLDEGLRLLARAQGGA